MNLYYQTHKQQINEFFSTNIQYALHLHKQVEILYLLEGQLIVRYAEQTDTLCTGDLFLAFPNLLHSYERLGDSKSILIIFDPKLSGDYQNTFHTMTAIRPVISSKDISPEINHCIHIIAEHIHDYSPSLLKGYLTVLSGHLLPVPCCKKLTPKSLVILRKISFPIFQSIS